MTNPFTLLETELQKMVSIHDKLQAEIREIHEEIKSLENRPDDTKTAVNNLKTFLAGQRDQELMTMIEALAHGREINDWNNRLFSQGYDLAGGNTGGNSRFVRSNLSKVLATFFEQTLLDHMTPMIEKYCKEHGGLTTEHRDKQLAELQEQARKLEEQEEAAIDESEINGVWTFIRRPDADPVVVLNLTE